MTTPSRLPDDLKDPLAKEQWWLFNSGQGVANNTVTPGTPGIDVNVLPLWPQYTGKGIKVGVVDDGIDGNHEDLAGNFNQSLSLPNDLGGPFPEDKDPTDLDNHGTAVAGIIAAKRNNFGTVGVAYEATIAGYKFNTSNESLRRQEGVDVSNNSWGSSYSFTPQANTFQNVQLAVANGRNKLGTVVVWSGGNSRDNVNKSLPIAQQRGSNANLQYRNSRYVINVAAIDNNGVVADYSNPGAPLLVSAFGDEGSIATVDRTGNNGYNTDATAQKLKNFTNPNYTNGFNGTSSAAPMVSGVAALILQANPKLGYRDVQEILAYSARQNDPGNAKADKIIGKDTWKFNGAKNWNGGGLHVNHDYGFGLVDATAAVRLAETWQLRSGGKNEAATFANENKREVKIENLTLPANLGVDDKSKSITGTFKVGTGINIDKLELDLNIEHGQFQDLVVKLTSPDNTESVILDRVPYFTNTSTDYGFKGTTVDFTFSSARHWGETGLGDWTLNISDNSDTNDPQNTGENGTSGNNIGKLKGATLRLYGDDIIPENTYIYTNEFASLTAAGDATRKTLTDTNGGNDIINTAAITDDVIVNLTPGSTSTLPGRELKEHKKLAPQTLTIAPGSIIENVFAGDGNDTIFGNDAANTLSGGRGNDTLVAVYAKDSSAGDTLIGGGGSDSLVGAIGNTTYILDAKTAAGSKIKNVGGVANNLILYNSTLPSTLATLQDSKLPKLTLTKTLGVGQNGIDKQGNDLLIDLNADGKIKSRDDLTIEDFYLPNSGRFQNVGNLLGNDILPTPTSPTPTTPTPTSPTPTTPTPTTPTPTTPTPTTPTPTTPTPTSPTPTTPTPTQGNDTLQGSAQNDTIDGLGGDDEISGLGGNDSLLGNAGDDYLNGGEGNDSLFGGAGNDILEDEFGNNLLSGGDGDDEVFGGSGADTLTGDAGDDYLNGDEGNDSLSGGAGNDFLDDDLGNNLLSGGDGDDGVLGGNGADTITGDAGNDSLFGNKGNDSISGGIGNDIADGGDGNDTLAGGDGNDELSGGADNDSINGGLGNDELYGDDGNDTLEGGGGADILFGGTGDDFYVLNATSAGGSIIADDSGTDSLTLNGLTLAIGLASGTAGVTRGGEFNTDLLIDLNKDGVFKAADDLLILDFFAEPNLEKGDGFIETVGNLSGDAILKSFPLKATPGPDFLEGGRGDDNIDGLAGNDTIEGNQGNDSLFGNAGNDVLNGDELRKISEAGGTVILGTGIGNDYLDGGDGDDTIDGGEGNDTLLGAAGDDSLKAGKGNDIINGGDGKDTLLGNEGNDSLFGGAGNDFLFGNEDNDTLDGGDGDDFLVGGLGNDSIVGGAGIDTVSYGTLPSPVNLNLATGTSTAEGTDTLRDIEVIIGTTLPDTIVGSSNSESLIGNGGADILTGGGGNDSFILDPTKSGGSKIQGAAGTDNLIITGNTLVTSLTPGSMGIGRSGTSLIVDLNKDGQINLANDVELLNFFASTSGNVPGTGFIETVAGTPGNTILAKFAIPIPIPIPIPTPTPTPTPTPRGPRILTPPIEVPNSNTSVGSTLNGGSINDFLFGSLQADALNGLAGDDTIYGLDGSDNIGGGDGNDSLFGNAGNDFIDAGNGNDVVYGGKDDDGILGSAGNDSLYGNDASDVVFGGDDNDVIFGGKGDDSLGGDAGDDSIFGQLGNDFLLGGSGNDVVNGGEGDDTISGIDPIATNPGFGEFDTLTGGEGKDRFLLGDSDKIYYSGDGNAVISDFNSVDDAIVLSGIKANYSLSVSGNVTSIFLKKSGQSDDLIATVQGVTDLNLDRPYFTFI